MDRLKETITRLKAIREEVGTSIYDAAVKAINRMRLDSDVKDRQPRKTFSWAVYQRHYKKQRGICPWCSQTMPLIKGQIEMDHINPNAEDFNADTNLQVLHKDCNREKSSMSISEQAKHLGTTFHELLHRHVEDEEI
jgi:5-methylcytosine-specific restriction endonuclease McrA